MKTSKLKILLPLAGLMSGTAVTEASTDYGPAVWYPCGCTKWYTSGSGHRFVVIHDMEGYYISSRSYLARCSVGASIHYLVNGKKDTSTDHAAGEVSQSVREAYYAWHVRCWNQYSVGTEHEGFASNPAWYTDAMYNATIALQTHLANHYGVAKDRNHIIGHNEHKNANWRSWMYSQGYSSSFVTCNTHSDPGPYWNWKRTIDGIKGVTSTPSAPSSLTLSVASSSQINLTWHDNSGIESGFKIERATASGGPFTQIGVNGANDVTYSATGLTSGTAYWFRVRAYNGSGNSGYSNTAGATTKDVVPGAPTSVTATAISNSQINLGWANGSGRPDGVKVERSTDNVTFTQIAQLGLVTSYSNTGLAGNTRYYYRLRSFNTAGNSAYSATVNDVTAPQPPSGLTAASAGNTPTTWNKINLTWVDNSSSEAGFKIERATAVGGPFTQIATNAASDATYTDSGLAATTTYYYRVRSYNANGNSAYSNTASAATPNPPPVLNAIGNKSVAINTLLTFTATATDPNQTVVTTTWENFESYTNNTPNEQVMFNRPSNSGSTSAFQDTSTNYTRVTTSFPTGHSSAKVMKVGWGFKTGQVNPWVRLNTYQTLQRPNPCMDGAQILRFDVNSTKALKIGVGMRETGTAVAYGANGGTTGLIDWAGVTNYVSGNPIASHQIAANTWTTLSMNLPFEPQWAFTGDGKVKEGKGVLEHLILGAVANASGSYTVYLDNFAVVAQNTLSYTLDAGYPAGAAIDLKTGKFTWTPTTAGSFTMTVRVTDQLGAQDSETIVVTVTSGAGNNPPTLAAIGNKTTKELTALAFTATATDPDAGQTLTYTLDAGNPSGSSINSSSGAFAWTPTEAQGPGSYPITVRVTDNGTPSANDFETITVTVSEVNAAPVVAAIANQTINEGGTLSLTASATDSDSPANTLTYSLEAGAPAGMTINSSSGAISWTAGEGDGPNTFPVAVRATDNGSPVLYGRQTFTVTVNEVNVAPVLTLGTTMTTTTPVDDFEFEDIEAPNGFTMFRTASFSSTTSAFVDAGLGVYSEIVDSSTYPDVDVNTSLQVLHNQWNFKTGTVNPWVRLTTYATPGFTNTYADPNPTIDLKQHVKFKVWSDKSIKVALGIRETATGVPIGFNGGTSGTIEWAGVTNVVNGCPIPTRVVSASNWTTLDFNLPAEPIRTFTGDGVLASGKGVLEHLVVVPNGGMGWYNVYLDDFQIVTVSTNLTIDTLATITVQNTATDADLPANNLTFSFGTGAPTNAVLDPETGLFTWTAMPDQSPSTNNIQIIVTDDGVPPLSDTKTLVVKVNKVNTAPRLDAMQDIETTAGQLVSFTATATDEDVPADTLTFSLTGTVPPGATINPTTGDFSWTASAGNSTNSFWVHVTDNGNPPLWDEQPINILVVPTNAAPVLTLGTSKWDETVVTFETFTNGTPNENVMFRKPSHSSTTSAYIDTTVANDTSVTTSFPTGHSGAKVLKANFTFKTSGANPYWCRLDTAIAAGGNIPNPTINFSSHLKFDIYTTKALLVGVGCRETGTAAAIGADGGITGAIEYAGCTNQSGSTPMPNRYVAANTWVTLDFNLPSEPMQTLTGNSVLAAGKGVLEHLILVGQGGTGAYSVYLDNFHVVTDTALPGTVNMTTGSALTFTATATDVDPGSGLGFGLDADSDPGAVIDAVTGAFTWTPAAAGTFPITVTVDDNPTNGAIPKSDSKTFTVVVTADPLGPK